MVIIDMNGKGDERHEFDAANSEAVDAAMAKFAELVGKGKVPAAVTGPGTSRKLRAFDPSVETIVFRPPFIGG